MAVPNIAVLIPWRDGCPHRERALRWTISQYRAFHPEWPIVLGSSPDGPFSRSAAILDAAAKSDASTFVVSDADIWVDPVDAIGHLPETGWAVPHRLIHRLSAESTERVYEGEDWRGLPLSSDNAQDRRPYVGNETGTIFTITREVLLDVPPDPRFAGWGQEDEAHAIALRVMVGKPWRGTADLVHLWHPAAPRLNRRVGSRENQALGVRYRNAARNRRLMADLVAEAKVASSSPVP